MSVNRNQHYIPRVLLKRWQSETIGGKRIYRFLRGADNAQQKALSQVASADYYYRDGIDSLRPDGLDTVLNKTESKIGLILDYICEEQSVPQRDSDEYQTLMRFIHDLYLRTPAARKRLAEAAPKELTRIIAELGKDLYPEEIERTLNGMDSAGGELSYLAELYRQTTGELDELSESSQKVLHYRAAGLAHQVILDQLSRRQWRLLVAPDSGPFFVTSDQPMVTHDANAHVWTGLLHRKTDASIPLSPRTLLQGCLNPVKPIAVVDAVKVRRLNGVLARAAYLEVFACESDFYWQHKLGTVHSAKEWLEGIPEARWPHSSS